MAASKTFLVTGAYSGIGSATAHALMANGHDVIGIDIREPDYALAGFHQCDLSDPASIEATVKALTGRYDSLLNIAGVPVAHGDELTMKVNILGLRQFTEGVWDRIADGGTVVNVSSLAGNNWKKRRNELGELLATVSFADGLAWWQANHARFDVDAYIVSKEAVVLYTMMLAGRGLERGISVNSVGPGPVETPLLPAFTEDTGEEMMQRFINIIGRAAQPAEIAEAIVVLAERRMGWVNAMHINVDGGLTAGLSLRWPPRG